jgi:predicted NBD/HSP70 family sugar kinase
MLKTTPPDFWKGNPEAVQAVYQTQKGKRILSRAAKTIATATTNIRMLLDPDEIILYSTILSGQNRFRQQIQEEYNKQNKLSQSRNISLEIANTSEFIAAQGAALLAMENIYPTEN